MNRSEWITKPNVLLVDVRESYEFEADSLEGSVNIPLSQLGARIDEITKHDGPVVLFCRSGNRSGMALAHVNNLGKHDVINGGGLWEMKMAKIDAEHALK